MNQGKTRYFKINLLVTLLVLVVLTTTGCEDFGTFPPPPSTFISSEDRAILAVYEHLLSQAESHEAKTYLAEFSATSDNWAAVSELYKDGSSTFYVSVDMSGKTDWDGKSYWQQAGWLVYRDGRVIPSNRLQANALRIEADLQELSQQTEP
jgi:hypothetical protein